MTRQEKARIAQLRRYCGLDEDRLTEQDPEPPLPWCEEANGAHRFRWGSYVWCGELEP